METEVIKKKILFTEIMEHVIIILMLISMIFIAQQFSMVVYQIGIVLLIISTFLQIAFSNMPIGIDFTKSIKLLIMILLIIFSVFGLGIIMTPAFISVVRG